MIRSIRGFLSVSILSAVIVVMLLTAAFNYAFIHKKFYKNMDNELILIATAVKTFVDNNQGEAALVKLQDFLAKLPSAIIKDNHKQVIEYFYLQLLDAQGNIIVNVGGLPQESLTTKLGFNDILHHGIFWRVFSLRDPTSNYTIIAAQRHNFRTSLENGIAKSSIITLIVAIPILWVLIFFIIHYLLRYLHRIGNKAEKRVPGRFSPLDVSSVPKEIKPLVNTINSMFNNLISVLKREKNFAEDAGHELQTPLAAIKVYSQVALNEGNAKNRDTALQNILQSVDRSAHSVHQLLVLSRILSYVYNTEIESVDLNTQISEVIAKLTPFALNKNIDIELITFHKQHQVVQANSNVINILLENLIDNAIRYTKKNDTVRISVEDTGSNVIIRIIDNGPGIPVELRGKVFNRFYRIVGTKEKGSGLGLSIVQQIANLYGIDVQLKTPFSGVGLEVEITFQK